MRNKWVVIIDQLLAISAVVLVLCLLTGAIDWQTGAALLFAMIVLYAISAHERRKASDGED